MRRKKSWSSAWAVSTGPRAQLQRRDETHQLFRLTHALGSDGYERTSLVPALSDPNTARLSSYSFCTDSDKGQKQHQVGPSIQGVGRSTHQFATAIEGAVSWFRSPSNYDNGSLNTSFPLQQGTFRNGQLLKYETQRFKLFCSITSGGCGSGSRERRWNARVRTFQKMRRD